MENIANGSNNFLNGTPLEHTIATPLPSLLVRVKALFLDVVILLIVFSVTAYGIDMLGGMPGFIRGGIAILMFFLYDPLLTSFFGGTAGHKMMRLNVKQYTEPERNISLPRAFLRTFIKSGLGWISFLTVTSTHSKRAIHDILSGSIVLRREA